MNPQDKELLVLSAAAAGVYLDWDVPGDPIARDGDEWKPLADDGDAFRLAVELGLDLKLSQFLPKAFDLIPGTMVPAHGDAFEAVRRKIVKAAAEIGRLK